jgi:hypothetical protein
MELMDIVTTLLGILLAVVGYVLKSLWLDIKKYRECQIRMENKIEVLDKTNSVSLDKLHHITSLKFKQLNEHLETFSVEIKGDIKQISREIVKLKISR